MQEIVGNVLVREDLCVFYQCELCVCVFFQCQCVNACVLCEVAGEMR